MNRRKAIENLVLLSIGAAVLPACKGKDETGLKLINFSLSGEEAQMMQQLSATLIPKTGFIGAEDVQAHLFTLMMVEDCYDPEKQAQFINGLKQFDKLCRDRYGKSFLVTTPQNKIALLKSIDQKKQVPEDVLFFYQVTRKHTLQAFTTSRDYMTSVIEYKMVPGSNFQGCAPVKKG